jgi:hypothetical protein
MRALATLTTPFICPPGYGGVREFRPFLVSCRANFVRYYTILSKSTILAAVRFILPTLYLANKNVSFCFEVFQITQQSDTSKVQRNGCLFNPQTPRYCLFVKPDYIPTSK